MREGRKEVAQLLRGKGGELGYDEVAASGELCELAKRGSLDLLQVLLDCGCSVNAADCTSALVEPTRKGGPISDAHSKKAVGSLVADDARTCLHLAASSGNLNICELLVDAKANINALDRWGGTRAQMQRYPIAHQRAR